MNGFQRRKEQSRENILRAAAALFGRFGVDRVSINDIAKEAGVSPVTIYNHFGSKQDLVMQWAQSVADDFLHRLEEIVTAKKSYKDKLESVFHAMLEAQEKDQRGDMDELGNYPEMARLMDEVIAKYFQLFARLIDEGKQQGYLSPDFSGDAVKVYFDLMMAGMKANPELHARTHQDPKMFRDFMLLILYGFAGERRQSP